MSSGCDLLKGTGSAACPLRSCGWACTQLQLAAAVLYANLQCTGISEAVSRSGREGG